MYEGNDKYINNNAFLGEMSIAKIKEIRNKDYKVKFRVDINSQLTILISIESLGLKKEEII